MEDKLRIFVQLHRQGFDTAEPAAHVWNNIEKQLDAGKTTDPLESFIRNNREDFDLETPDLRIWSNISGGLEGSAPKMRTLWISKISRIAAAIALLVTSLGVGIWYGQNNPNGSQAGMGLAEVSDEYAELERYYQGDIAAKKQKLVSYTSNDTEKDVLNDLEQMDTIMEELRTELANVPPGNREQVVRAMIENYKAKAAILQRVLERLETQDAFENNRKQNIDNI